MDTMKATWERTRLTAGVNDVDYATYARVWGKDAARIGWWDQTMTTPSREQQLIWGLETTGYARRDAMQKLFEDTQGCAFEADPTGGKDVLVNPVYGINGTRDCGPGYVQVKAGGCCVRVDTVISLWEADEVRANVSNAYRGMSQGEAEELRRYLEDGVAELNQVLSQSKFKSAREAKFVMELVASMQNTTVTRLGARLDEIWNENAESCEEESDAIVGPASAAFASADQPLIPRGSLVEYMAGLFGDALMRFLRGLWWLTRKMLGFAWEAVKVVVGGTVRVLKSVGDKIAFS
jgi:hypothetical protein